MAKGLVLSLDGKTSSFQLEKVERAKLYGVQRRLALDERSVLALPIQLPPRLPQRDRVSRPKPRGPFRDHRDTRPGPVSGAAGTSASG